MMTPPRHYILALCSDPNVVYASIHEEDGKTYITIDCDNGTEEDPYYGYDGRLSTWKYGPKVIEAVKALVSRLNAAA